MAQTGRFQTGLFASAAALAILSGCTKSPPPVTNIAAPVSAPMASGGPDPFADRVEVTRIAAKDRISIQVLREPELSLQNVRVGEDGHVDMPIAGRIPVAGRTTADVAVDIRERLARDYLRDPQVAVNIVDFASHRVTVEGAVLQPGVYQFEPDTTLLGAIAMARGPSRSARLNQVAIFRRVDGERSVAVFDLAQVRSGAMVDPAILPGDRVLIGFDGLSQAWQDFLMAVPLIAVFTRF